MGGPRELKWNDSDMFNLMYGYVCLKDFILRRDIVWCSVIPKNIFRNIFECLSIQFLPAPLELLQTSCH